MTGSGVGGLWGGCLLSNASAGLQTWPWLRLGRIGLRWLEQGATSPNIQYGDMRSIETYQAKVPGTLVKFAMEAPEMIANFYSIFI